MPIRLHLCAGAVALCLGGSLAMSASGNGSWAGVFKMLASTAFLALAWWAGAPRSVYGMVIFLGLIFSWWGDLFLISSQPKLFLAGLIVFFLAHVAYLGAFVGVLSMDWRWFGAALAIMVVPAALVLYWIHPGLGEMRYPVYAYVAVISLMVAGASGAMGRGATALVLIGAVLFYVSDIFVARGRFVHGDFWNQGVGLPLYYAGQVLLPYSIWPVTQALRG